MDATLHNRLKAFHSILSFIGIKKLSGNGSKSSTKKHKLNVKSKKKLREHFDKNFGYCKEHI